MQNYVCAMNQNAFQFSHIRTVYGNKAKNGKNVNFTTWRMWFSARAVVEQFKRCSTFSGTEKCPGSDKVFTFEVERLSFRLFFQFFGPEPCSDINGEWGNVNSIWCNLLLSMSIPECPQKPSLTLFMLIFHFNAHWNGTFDGLSVELQ